MASRPFMATQGDQQSLQDDLNQEVAIRKAGEVGETLTGFNIAKAGTRIWIRK
jgi:hypothetical protein